MHARSRGPPDGYTEVFALAFGAAVVAWPLAVERDDIVPPVSDGYDADFRSLVLQLRGRTGLTQRELAARLGVHVHSLQGWEAGISYPGVASLRALIVAGLQAGAFLTGREVDDAVALWEAVRRESPRLRTPFDHVWFAGVIAGETAPGDSPASASVVVPPAPEPRSQPVPLPASPPTAVAVRRQSWGEAPDIASFLGRASEREQLADWLLDGRCRVVAVLGLGGIGKSLLATRLARDLAPSFEQVFWRSLRDAPTPGEWLSEALGFLSPDDPVETADEPALLRRLLELLGESRCLLVLDNVETVLEPGGRGSGYRPGFERFGTLLRQLAETPHRSSLLLTSREEPPELGPLRGEQGPVRILHLTGLGVDDGRALLNDKRLDGDEAAWQALIGRCGGNGLALKVVGETTRELFGGSIADYLEYADATPGVMVGGVRELLGAQIRRLSDVEQELLRRMAVERGPVGLADLAAELGPRIGRGATLEAVEGLRRRSLLERTEGGPQFRLHSVVLEYVTEQLIEEVARELVTGQPVRLLRQALLKATGKDYARRSQERLIAGPILERLVAIRGSARASEQWLVDLLDQERARPQEDQGYGPGNLVNLLRLLRGDLRGIDLSGLTIRQAYLPDVEAQGASLAGAHLSETVLGEAFSYPTSLALSADGAYLVAGTASGEVCRWRVADRTLLTTVPGHTAAVWGMAWGTNGQLVASGSLDGTVRLWDAETGRALVTLRGHDGGVWGAALSGDGQRVASGGVDGTVRLWEAVSGTLLATLRGHTGEVYAVALSDDGRLVASGSLDGTVRLWDAESGRERATLNGHTNQVYAVAMSRDGRLVASGSLDGTVRLWETETGQMRAVLQGHTGGVRGVAMSATGQLIASSGFDGTVRLWEGGSGQPLAALQGHFGGVRGVAVSGDGRLVASSGFDGTVRLWEAESGLLLAALQGHSGGVWGVAVSGDGRVVASGSLGTVRLWDAENGQPLATLQGHTGGVWGLAMSADGRLVASASHDGLVRLWDAELGTLLGTLQGHSSGVCGVALSRDGRLVASSSYDGTVRLWDADRRRPLGTLHGHAAGVRAVALSGDGRLVASGGVDGTVRLWDAESGRPLFVQEGHAGGVWGVALSGDGHLVASGGFDGKGRLWEAATGRLLATLLGHTGGLWSMAVSEDGQLVASGGVDRSARLWEAGNGEPRSALRGHTGGVWSMAVSGDGTVVASGGDDGTVRLWDPATGANLRVLRADRRYEHVDITGLTGVTEAQRQVLFALGAVDRQDAASPGS